MTRRIDRDDAAGAAEFVEQLIPDTTARTTFLSYLADSIIAANEAGPKNWNLAIRDGNRLQLNVGNCSLLLVYADRIEVYFDETLLPEDLQRELPGRFSGFEFVTLPTARAISLGVAESSLLERLQRAHLALVSKAAPAMNYSPRSDNHYTGLTTYISEFLGIELPDPDYVLEAIAASPASSESRLGELDNLYADFIREYPNTQAGAKHALQYQEGRSTAKKNYAEICSLADLGENVVDRILLHLLPHANNKGNKERGAWIHVAPAITKDAKALFEGAHWVSPESWPSVTSSLLAFVRQCVEHPGHLDEAVNAFKQKGLQAGMVSPILSSLRPDAFIINNKKTRALLSFLAGKTFGQTLSGYPQFNSTGLREIERLRPLFGQHDRPQDLTDADLFDMFSHWLVAVRKFKFGKKTTALEPDQAGHHTWIFQANPNYFDIKAALDQLDEMTWVVRQHRKTIRPNDTVYVWESGSKGGVLAKATVLTEPGVEDGAVQTWKFAKDSNAFDASEPRVQLRIEDVLNAPISRISVKAHAVLKHLKILGTAQGTNFAVAMDQATALEELYAMHAAADEAGDTIVDSTEALTETADDLIEDLEPNPAYDLSEVSEETGFDRAELERWVRAIERKNQAILYGPPGTGKTFVAEKLARHLAGGGTGIVDLVQLHPAYAYEDFMQGLRPRATDKGLEFSLAEGRFLEFCRKASARKGTSVLIVDEINRANLARVFGELMYLLEYRDKEIPLAGGGRFSIPPEVRIIGTMNTADRSIALVDHALRRRFAFLELRPQMAVLRKHHAGSDFPIEKLISIVDKLNGAIGDPHYAVGISFFLCDNIAADIEDIWRMEVEPYIEEYFFDRSKLFEEYRWAKVRVSIFGSEEPVP